MIELVQNTIAQYISDNADVYSWESVRGMYGAYTYVAFLCMSVNSLGPVSSIDDVIDLALFNGIETKPILGAVKEISLVESFAKEIIDIIKQCDDFDIEHLYQKYLAIDFAVKDGVISFQDGKNSRDILGSYYTQEKFAFIIASKAINDYLKQNSGSDTIRIVDYSCGGAIFLRAALDICNEKNIAVELFGYDVDPVAILVARLKILNINKNNEAKVNLILGNPLLPPNGDCVEKYKKAISGRYYNLKMGVKTIADVDIILGNPPWEKVRFEEKKFLKHFESESILGTKSEREKMLKSVTCENLKYYKALINDYEECKRYFKASDCYRKSNCGEINTYALFTELSYNMLKHNGIAGLIVKSSLVKLPVYKLFFRELANDGELYDLYMFTNRNKIFNIDSREEFSVIYLSKGGKKSLSVALDLDDYNKIMTCTKATISYEDLCKINPETGMIPSIRNDKDLLFLLGLSKRLPSFGEVYEDCRYGRLVHLTNHAKYIQKKPNDGLEPIYEGKFIELYTGKYATFKGMSEDDMYKNKASARLIDNPQGNEYPECRFYIQLDEWNKISKNFEKKYVLAWRSLTSATNRRTMLATILPLMPTCQSIQLLQLNDLRQMLHVLALFDSIVFDYIARLKMVGLDLTQTIIKQIPVPRIDQYDETLVFKGIKSTISTHILSRLCILYKDDKRVKDAFQNLDTYEINEDRKKIIAEIDCLFGHLYGLSKETMKSIASSFDAFYSDKEVAAYF